MEKDSLSFTGKEKGIKKEYWYKELESHIRVVHAASGHHKTILITGPRLYQVATRVNYLTISLWRNHVNGLIKSNKLAVDPINRISWLVMQKKYRKEFLNEILNKINEQ